MINKADFVKRVQKTGDFPTAKSAQDAVNAVFETITAALKEGETIQIIGFGTFSTKKVKEKSGKIPGSDKKYLKPAHTAPTFKFGKSVKEAVN